MVKVETVIKQLEKQYESLKTNEQKLLHDAVVEILNEQQPSIENAVFVLDLVRFTLMSGKYKETMGQVKLTNKLPLPTKK